MTGAELDAAATVVLWSWLGFGLALGLLEGRIDDPRQANRVILGCAIAALLFAVAVFVAMT